jgi:4-hydroxybenzoate polyprenyltransferase
MSPYEALCLFGALIALALWLVTRLDALTVRYAFVGAALTITYPFMKRFFPLPQLYLGAAFGWAIPMGFVALQGHVPQVGWLLFLVAVLWAGVYDTVYAMVDRDDDLRLGLRTSAITFGRYDVIAIAMSYGVLFISQVWVAQLANLSNYFLLGWFAALACAIYHLKLVSTRNREDCFKAFRHNNWLGGFLFLGIVLGLSIN